MNGKIRLNFPIGDCYDNSAGGYVQYDRFGRHIEKRLAETSTLGQVWTGNFRMLGREMFNKSDMAERRFWFGADVEEDVVVNGIANVVTDIMADIVVDVLADVVTHGVAHVVSDFRTDVGTNVLATVYGRSIRGLHTYLSISIQTIGEIVLFI
jgi:hypothetical protein